MKKITTVLALFALALFVTSCNNKDSLQLYLVKAQEKDGFINFDLPANVIKPKSLNVPDDVKETMNSIRKINLVALPYQGNEDTYEAEKTELKRIFSNKEKYINLMRMNSKGYKISLYYTGDADAIDEVIAFGYAKDQGLGIARILGDDMDPSKIITMMNNIDVDGGGLNLNAFDISF